MARLSEDVRGHLRFFAFFLGNGSLQVDGMRPVDYSHVLTSVGAGSALEQVFAIWSNLLEVDSAGKVTNEHHAKQRAAQYLRQQADSRYVVDPPFEDWEIALHM